MSVLSYVYYGYSSFIKNYIIGYLIPSPTLGLCLCMVPLEAKGQPWESFLEHRLPCIVTGLSLCDSWFWPDPSESQISTFSSSLSAGSRNLHGCWGLNSGTFACITSTLPAEPRPSSLKMYLWRCPQVAIGVLFCLFSPFLGALFPALSPLMPRI